MLIMFFGVLLGQKRNHHGTANSAPRENFSSAPKIFTFCFEPFYVELHEAVAFMKQKSVAKCQNSSHTKCWLMSIWSLMEGMERQNAWRVQYHHYFCIMLEFSPHSLWSQASLEWLFDFMQNHSTTAMVQRSSNFNYYLILWICSWEKSGNLDTFRCNAVNHWRITILLRPLTRQVQSEWLRDSTVFLKNTT